ncbi:MAG: hypothetical protein D6800_08400, partial [Candidatus Zixiibacteriota bacterium]
DYTFDAYTKLVVYDNTKPDSLPIVLIAESQTTSYWEQPNKYKEIIRARRQSANLNAEENLLTVGEILNFNRNRIEIGRYRFVSPTARDALNYYNYYLLDTITVDHRRVFRLEIEPKNAVDPLFTGMIQIADSTYDVVAVDVGVSEAVSFPFVDSIRYAQTLAPFADGYWLPVQIRFTARMNLPVPFPGFPRKMKLFDVASLYHYTFEAGSPPGTFDEYELEVADDADRVDSSTWAAGQTIPLTAGEHAGYRRIDSLAHAPKPWYYHVGMAAVSLAALGLGADENIFHFNRVEGPYLGLKLGLGRYDKGARVWIRHGYAFEARRWHQQYGAAYAFRGKSQLRLRLEYIDGIVRRPVVMSKPDRATTFTAVTGGIDPFDYFREQGVRFSSVARPLSHTLFVLTYNDFRQTTEPIRTDFSLFDRDKPIRPNPVVADGHLRSVGVTFWYDSRKRVKIKGGEWLLRSPQFTRFTANAEIAEPDLFNTDFEYRRYEFAVTRKQQVFRFGNSLIRGGFGFSTGALPPQKLFVVDYGEEVFFSRTGFNTLNETNFVGDRFAFIALDHDFGRRLFVWSRLPGIRKLPWRLSLHGGVFWSDFRNHKAYRSAVREPSAPRAYSELGFGLGNLTPFLSPFNLALSFTWQLSAYDTERFSFQFDLKL